MIGEPARNCRRWDADVAWPGCGRSAIRSAANVRSVPSWPSTLIAAARSRGVEQQFQVGERQHQHAEHAVGAVDQREAFLLREQHRSEAVVGEGLSRRRSRSGVDHRALTDERQRAVGERREVAGAAEAAVLVHHRHQPGVQQRSVGGDRGGADAAVAAGEGGKAQQHHRAHHFVLDARAVAGSVRADQALLQPGAVAGGDAAGGQRPEAGGHPVHPVAARGEDVDVGAGCCNSRLGLRRQRDAGARCGRRRRHRTG